MVKSNICPTFQLRNPMKAHRFPKTESGLSSLSQARGLGKATPLQEWRRSSNFSAELSLVLAASIHLILYVAIATNDQLQVAVFIDKRVRGGRNMGVMRIILATAAWLKIGSRAAA